MAEAEWDALGVPINMAFFARKGPDRHVIAHYPGAAGAIASSLDPDAWASIEAANPILREMLPDVEALLVHRVGAAREHYLVSIDVGYRLAGLIRTRWRGLSGGAEVWEEIGRFFDRLRATSTGAAHA